MVLGVAGSTTRRASGGLLVGLGLLTATLTWVALSLQLTVLSADRLADSASELLEADQVRNALSGKVEDEIAVYVPAAVGTPQLDAATDSTLDDPRFVSAFEQTLIALHEYVFQGRESTLFLDSGAVSSAAVTSLREVDPALATQVPPDARLNVSLADIGEVPELSWVTTLVNTAIVVGAVVALALLAGGVAAAADRTRPVARIGRWAVVLAVAQLVAALLLPLLFLVIVGGGWLEVGVRTWKAFAAGLVVPAIVLGIVGAGLLVVARQLRPAPVAAPVQPASPAPPPPPPPPAAAPAEPVADVPPPAGDSPRERVRDWVWPDS